MKKRSTYFTTVVVDLVNGNRASEFVLVSKACGT